MTISSDALQNSQTIKLTELENVRQLRVGNETSTHLDFQLNEEVSTPTTDHRRGRNEVKIEKLRYIREYKHLENIVDAYRKEVLVTLKKTGRKRT